MRRPSPSKYSVSTVSSVRQMMRTGGYLARYYPALSALGKSMPRARPGVDTGFASDRAPTILIRQPDRTAEFRGRSVVRRDRRREGRRHQPERRIHRHGKCDAPIGVGLRRGFAQEYLALGVAGIGIGVKLDHGARLRAESGMSVRGQRRSVACHLVECRRLDAVVRRSLTIRRFVRANPLQVWRLERDAAAALAHVGRMLLRRNAEDDAAFAQIGIAASARPAARERLAVVVDQIARH